MKKKFFVSLSDSLRDFGATTLNGFHSLLVTVLITAFTGLLVVWALGYPGGPAGMIGNFLAQYCLQSGACDLDQTFPAFGLAMLILVNLLVYIFNLIKQFTGRDNHEELLDKLEEVEELLVRLPEVLDENVSKAKIG